ncbi:MAG TPA: TonB-dependent receptor [Ignavibacteriaceae bacterium]|nr:TonB-dependent receptor [Ignavibacteriaceae bacterium]
MILILVFLFSFGLHANSESGNLKGSVKEGSVPIPGVNILLVDTPFGTVTDFKGNYNLRSIPVGNYRIRFSAIGYATKFFNINVENNRTIELNVQLETEAIVVDEVEVIGKREREVNDTRTSILDLDPKSAKILPGAAEDVLRTLQSLPGVLAPNDFSSQLVIRGSGPDQNLIIIDDVEIFNPYRLYGLISMFNPDAVSEVNLITGGFAAKYGDRLSAVLDVTNKEGDRFDRFKGSLNASIVSANIVVEGRNPLGINGSWMLNSRRTYYDLILEPIVKNAGLVEENVSFPNFYDIQGKIVLGPFKGHKLIFTGINSEDGVNVVSSKNRKTPDSVSAQNLTKNNVLSFSHQFTPTKNFSNKLTASWYTNQGGGSVESEFLDPTLNRKNFENVSADTLAPYLLGFKVRSEFTFEKYSISDKLYYYWGNNLFEAGAGVDFLKTIIDFKFDLDPELKAIFSANPGLRTTINSIKDIKNYKRYNFYLQNNFELSNNFYIQPGLRYDYYEVLDKSYFAPRISLSYGIDDLTTIRGSWGIYYQSPGYEKLRDQNTFYDLTRKYTEFLESEKAIHYVVGLERWLTSEWLLRTEAYYKDFRDLIVQQIEQGGNYFTERVPGGDIRSVSGWTRPVRNIGDSLTQIPINNSFGEAYGVEFLLEKKNSERGSNFSGWISYAYAHANRYQRRDIIPFAFDQRHTVNIVGNYSLGSNWELGFRWQYGSGFPYTEPIGLKPRILLLDTDNDGKPETPVVATRASYANPNSNEVIFDIDYGDRNRFNARKPAYHRLDIRVTKATILWNYDWTFYLDIINIYNRTNVVGYSFYVEDDLTLGRETNSMFPILPTIGFSVKF